MKRAVPAALLALPALAHAATGNFLPLLASFLLVVPALLLAPAVAIALSRRPTGRKRAWVAAALALAFLSYGSLWWANQAYQLTASESWPWIYLWTLPALVVWSAFVWANRSTG